MGAMPIPGTPSRAELVDHLVQTRIAGDVATPRENNLSHYRKLANGDRHYWLGLELGDRWTDEQDVLAVMAERVRRQRRPRAPLRAGHHRPRADRRRAGPDGRRGCARRPRAGSGCCSPPGTRAGCWTCTARRPPRCARPAARSCVDPGRAARRTRAYVMQFADVAMLEHGATLWHTHSGEPMEAILDGAGARGPPAARPGRRRPRLGGLRGPARRRLRRLRRLQRPGAVPRRGGGHRSRWRSRSTTTSPARATTTR